jgi:uncharacterized protein YutE (UPF0331/DUF86 family)
MVRVDLVQHKVRRLRETLAALRACLLENPADLAGSRDACDLVSFRVYLAMQEAIDIASHLIADAGWGPAPSLREHFAILATRGVLDASLADQVGARVRSRVSRRTSAARPRPHR